MYKFFPNDIKSYLTTFLDTQSLISFASTTKENLKLALPQLLQHKKKLLLPPRINLVTSGRTTFIYTTKSVYACGYNKQGQLGIGHKKNCSTFTKIENIEGKILQVVAEHYHTFILTEQGLYVSGQNAYGRLGCGDIDSLDSFMKIKNIHGKIKEIIVKSSHTFLLTDHALYACGDDEFGKLGLGDNQDKNKFMPVENIEGEIKKIISDSFRTYVITDHGLYSCGENQRGTLGVGNNQDKNKFMPVENIEGNIHQVITDPTHTFLFTDKGSYACGSYNNKNKFTKIIKEGLVNSLISAQDDRMLSIFNMSDITPGAKINLTVEGSNYIEATFQQIIAENDCHFFLTDRGLFSRGKNEDGQLGLGSVSERNRTFTKVEIIPADLKDLLNAHSQIKALQNLATKIENSSANLNEFDLSAPMMK